MKTFLFFLALSIASTGAEDSSSTDVKDKFSALARARSLNPPVPMATYGGDIEDQQFWTTNEQLIQDALKEYGKHHSQLYDFNTSFQEKYMEPTLKEAVRNKDLRLLSSLIHETDAPGVYAVQIFNSDFTKDFLEELDHYESSGIPLRRPNSMNRYGVILSMIGFGNLINGIVGDVLNPLTRHLFGDFASPTDLQENYPFTVRYKPEMDRNLTEHTDHSTITVNICLESSSAEKVLYFKNRKHSSNKKISEDDSPKFVSMSTPGMGLIHLGQHEHGVREVHGERTQLVIWMFGEDGYVRVAPYDKDEIPPHGWLSNQDENTEEDNNRIQSKDEL